MTFPTLEQVARDLAARSGAPIDMVMRDAEIEWAALRNRAAEAATAAAPAPPEPPAFTWDRYDAIDRRNTAAFDRQLDPERAATRAAKRAEIEQRAASIRAQRDALNRQLQTLDDEWHANL